MLNKKHAAERLRYLCDTYGSSMYAIAERILRDSYMAEDVVQETLIRIYREEIIEKLLNMDEERIKAYILLTTKNVAINFYRQRKREATVPITEVNEESLNNISTENDSEKVLQRLQEEDFFRIVQRLPEKYSYVLISKYRYELSDKQIAAACGINAATVRKRLERGRKMLSERLRARNYLREYGREYENGGGKYAEEQTE